MAFLLSSWGSGLKLELYRELGLRSIVHTVNIFGSNIKTRLALQSIGSSPDLQR